MFSIRLFRQQYFVGISLFANLEHARESVVDYRHPNVDGTYAIKWPKEYKQIGWAHVSPYASAVVSFNREMREKRRTFAIWQDGRLYEWWWNRPPPDLKTLDDVQLTVAYQTSEKYERQAVNTAWKHLLEGHPGYIEWYDASPGGRWTKLFRPRG